MKIETLPPTEGLPPFFTFGDCKKGETSAKTGCTPSSGGGGKKEGEAPKRKGERKPVDKEKAHSEWAKARKEHVAWKEREAREAEASGTTQYPPGKHPQDNSKSESNNLLYVIENSRPWTGKFQKSIRELSDNLDGRLDELPEEAVDSGATEKTEELLSLAVEAYTEGPFPISPEKWKKAALYFKKAELLLTELESTQEGPPRTSKSKRKSPDDYDLVSGKKWERGAESQSPKSQPDWAKEYDDPEFKRKALYEGLREAQKSGNVKVITKIAEMIMDHQKEHGIPDPIRIRD